MTVVPFRFVFAGLHVALGLVLVLLVDAQNSPLTRASGGRIVNVSQPARYSEPSIAVNPSKPSQVLVVYQGGPSVQGSANAAYSNDGGTTFTIAEGTRAADWKVLGDVTTTFDHRGHAYLCYLAFDRLGTAAYWANGAGRNGIFVRRSLDGGRTWEQQARTIKAWPTGHESGLQFEDEPRVFADTSAGSPYLGNLYCRLGGMATR